jgi:hypothetical protein
MSVSVLNKALKKEGIRLQGDALPKELRTVKAFQRLIAAMRACEQEVVDHISDLQTKYNESLKVNVDLQGTVHDLQDEVHQLKGECAKFRLADWSAGLQSLTSTDRQRMLEVAFPAANGDG